MALIEIGSSKQLFVDDYLIESLTNTKQVLNPAEKVEHNPIIAPEHPWEGNYLGLSHVVFDEKSQLFKMKYNASNFKAYRKNGKVVIEGEGPGSQGCSCAATSEDGIHWTKPTLGLVEFEGSRENNIIPKEHAMGCFKDLHEKDPAKRYKSMVKTGSTDTTGMTYDLYYSPDTFHWTPYEGNPVIGPLPRMGRWGPESFMGWDPIRQVYAVHMENCLHRNSPIHKRLIGRAESPDMLHWSEPETIILPDEKDPPDTEFYSMPAITYEGLYIGLLWIFSTTNTTHQPELAVSRDGIHYERNYREPFIPRGPKGDFDSVSLYSNAPALVGDRFFTYYSGVNWRSPEMLVELGDKASGAIGLAITPLDGFVSLDGAKDHYSKVVTRSFSFEGTKLYLNLRSALQQWGAEACDVRVELLRPNHELLPGFGFDDADPITATGQAQVVSWQGKSDLSELAGGPIKLRFYFKNAKLYSFQFK